MYLEAKVQNSFRIHQLIQGYFQDIILFRKTLVGLTEIIGASISVNLPIMCHITVQLAEGKFLSLFHHTLDYLSGLKESKEQLRGYRDPRQKYLI